MATIAQKDKWIDISTAKQKAKYYKNGCARSYERQLRHYATTLCPWPSWSSPSGRSGRHQRDRHVKNSVCVSFPPRLRLPDTIYCVLRGVSKHLFSTTKDSALSLKRRFPTFEIPAGYSWRSRYANTLSYVSVSNECSVWSHMHWTESGNASSVYYTNKQWEDTDIHVCQWQSSSQWLACAIEECVAVNFVQLHVSKINRRSRCRCKRRTTLVWR